MVPHSIPGNQYDEMNLNSSFNLNVLSNPILTHVATINQSLDALFFGEA